MKHLLKLMDLSAKEISEILNIADQLKYERKNGIPHHILEGKINVIVHLVKVEDAE